jgi:DnaJ-class molecular chaperone
MYTKATVPCDACQGRGIVPHTRRTIENNKPDPFDQQSEELCSKCGGNGRMRGSSPERG